MSEIKVLDKGFVRLVDHLGSDEAIVRAARVSYGKGTRKISEDETLIRYLMRNQHTSPFEMCEVVFHIKLPIFVMRQLVRHRTACLSGDTNLYFDLPAALNKGKRHRYNITVKEFYDKWHTGAKPIPHRVSKKPLIIPLKERISSMKLRCCNEDSGEIVSTNVIDIWESGLKDVFEVELDNGYKIKTSKDHKFLTNRGWLKLKDFVTLDGPNISFFDTEISLASNGIECYKSEEWLRHHYWDKSKKIAEIAKLAGVATPTIRKWLKVFNLQDTNKLRLSSKFQKGNIPWNTGKKYSFNLSEEEHKRRSQIMKRVSIKGSKSNLWKGGTSSERANIGRWTRNQAPHVFKKFNYLCAITGKSEKLVTHHIDPVWHHIQEAYNFDNLICLCEESHKKIHSLNLELEFLRWWKLGKNLSNFFVENNIKLERHINKSRPKVQKLAVRFLKIKKVKYIGKEQTYDLEVKGPYHNFVANGFIVHNSLNEISARYSVLPDECYIPENDKVTFQNPSNKQGGTNEILTPLNLKNPQDWWDCIEPEDLIGTWNWQHYFEEDQKIIRQSYERYVDSGMRRELARINLPVSQYTECYWKMDLRNLFHFLKLRLDSHAQYEIRVYAEAIFGIIKPLFPISCRAFEDYILNAITLTQRDIKCLSKLISMKDNQYLIDDYFTNKREREEFIEKLGKLIGG